MSDFTKTDTMIYDNFVLRVETMIIDVTSNAPRRDPDWRYIDKEGHLHALVAKEWPTLTWVVDRTYWCDSCNDEHQEGHYECNICGETIEPGMRPSPGHAEHIEGRREYFLNDEPISEEDAKELMTKWREAMR